jgi:hypothetical protein
VRTVGIDAPSIDPRPATAPPTGGDGLAAHRALLGAGGVVVENLTGLAAVDHPAPVLSVLPLALRGGDGSPVRAVALLPAVREAPCRRRGPAWPAGSSGGPCCPPAPADLDPRPPSSTG